MAFFLPCDCRGLELLSKEKILKKVRLALNFKQKNPYLNIDLDSSVFAPLPSDESLVESFARNFTTHNGSFIACDNQFDFIDKFLTLIEQRKWKFMFCWEDDLQKKLKDVTIPFVERKEQLEKIQASITSCEAAIARTGSLLGSVRSQELSRTYHLATCSYRSGL
jgi:L-lactate dehydrogenase complex protein LldG